MALGSRGRTVRFGPCASDPTSQRSCLLVSVWCLYRQKSLQFVEHLISCFRSHAFRLHLFSSYNCKSTCLVHCLPLLLSSLVSSLCTCLVDCYEGKVMADHYLLGPRAFHSSVTSMICPSPVRSNAITGCSIRNSMVRIILTMSSHNSSQRHAMCDLQAQSALSQSWDRQWSLSTTHKSPLSSWETGQRFTPRDRVRSSVVKCMFKASYSSSPERNHVEC